MRSYLAIYIDMKNDFTISCEVDTMDKGDVFAALKRELENNILPFNEERMTVLVIENGASGMDLDGPFEKAPKIVKTWKVVDGDFILGVISCRSIKSVFQRFISDFMKQKLIRLKRQSRL